METQKKKKGSLVFDFFIALVFLAGLGIMLYPQISDWVNRRNMSRAVTVYGKTVQGLSPEEQEAILAGARDYNRRLKENPAPFLEPGRTTGYLEALRVRDSDIMGYVMIEKIRVRLPFYHGTEESVLQTAIGHLEGSSLPVGDPGEHAVLSAHRGLPSAKLFTDLPELVIGDMFSVTVLDHEMVYKVDQVLTVLPDSPEAFEALRPVPGEDLVTLMTCTPYGVNTHRLLVRGHRTADRVKKEEDGSTTEGGDEAGRSFDSYIPYVAGAAAVIFLILMFAPVKKKKRGK